MAILYQAPAARPWRRAVLVTAALSIGVALAWSMRLGEPDAGAARPAMLRAPATPTAAPRQEAALDDATCDARCAAAKVIVAATTACAASVEELAGFRVRWLDSDASRPKFDRFAWLDRTRGTLTFGGAHAEFRNAGGAYLPVDYDCDFDPATLTALQARARPRASAQAVAVSAAAR